MLGLMYLSSCNKLQVISYFFKYTDDQDSFLTQTQAKSLRVGGTDGVTKPESFKELKENMKNSIQNLQYDILKKILNQLFKRKSDGGLQDKAVQALSVDDELRKVRLH